uniref:ATP synthase complex subunit 8 n=1 Tax=Mukaria splendida TaxID=2586309 RepID=A0A7L8ZUF1_9HEMI|nr:ATP synthase F0 subunit 8 [Mukaria splendida]QOI73918.1 ATP synthase F0 subunit 8 [Mukaria splendida]
MPQMAPTWWTTIMLLTILMMMITMNMIYFIYTKKVKNQPKKTKKPISWQW